MSVLDDEYMYKLAMLQVKTGIISFHEATGILQDLEKFKRITEARLMGHKPTKEYLKQFIK